MQIDPHAIMPSQDGSVHSWGEAVGAVPASNLHGFYWGFMAPCACHGGGAQQPLHVAQRQGIMAALQDSGQFRGVQAIWVGLWDLGGSHGPGGKGFGSGGGRTPVISHEESLVFYNISSI